MTKQCTFQRKFLELGSVSALALFIGGGASFEVAASAASSAAADAVSAENAIIATENTAKYASKTAKSESNTAKSEANAANSSAAPSTRYQISAQPLAEALLQFSTQSNVMVIAAPDLLQGKTAPSVVGPMSSDDALKSLLKDSGLGFQKGKRGEIIIRPGDAEKISMAAPATNAAVPVANSSRSQAGDDGDGEGEGLDQEDNNPFLGPLTKEELEEIVVTGSNIRGARSASPVFVFGRKDIDQTGVSTLPDFIQTLPQNFGGGMSESTFGVVPSGSDNVNRGTGVNLRGLGNDSTLVLLNGRRLAPAGIGNFVDISMIPLTAIERVEVLTDGASAIYGSDAVGGVVNFRLRDDYEGAETRLRYGTATSGDLDDIQVGQTFGTTWDSGHALISYEYQKRDRLDANDRSFSMDAEDPTDLLPEQKRHSFFLTAGQNLNETIKVFGDAYYSRRLNNAFRLGDAATAEKRNGETEQYGVSTGVRAALGGDWQAEFVGSFSQNDVSGDVLTIETGDVSQLSSHTSTAWVLDGKADGTLFRLSGGDVKLAVGGQIRRETFEEIQPIQRSSVLPDIDVDRTVNALFGEMFVPLVGEDNRRAGIERLELTVAGRYEDYSDFGSSTDSKLGLLWSPVEGFNLRGTYGTSFRAPLFRELAEELSLSGFLLPFSDPSSPSGTTLAAFVIGNNSNLDPETATTWTAGIDIAPPSLPGLSIQATYFNIDFQNRIAAADVLFDAFTDPKWTPVVDRNPDLAFLTFLASRPFSQNFTGGAFEFTDAEALIDARLRNLASVQTSGLDFTISYSWDIEVGRLGFNLGGTYLFEQLEQLIETDEPFDVVDTAFSPTDLKLRGSMNWVYDGFSTNLAVNYVDSYRNVQVTPVADVSSWTTVDLNISYNTGAHGNLLDNTVFSLNALNLFDQDPPFVAAFIGLNSFNYDPTNASPTGRTIALQITKQW